MKLSEERYINYFESPDVPNDGTMGVCFFGSAGIPCELVKWFVRVGNCAKKQRKVGAKDEWYWEVYHADQFASLV